MLDETSRLLVNLQAESPESYPYVFVSPERLGHIQQRIKEGTWNSKCETVNDAINNFTSLCKKAEIAKYSIQDMKISAIINWLQHLPIQVVQQFTGHSNIATTREYYISVRSEDIDSASQILDKIVLGAKYD